MRWTPILLRLRTATGAAEPEPEAKPAPEAKPGTDAKAPEKEVSLGTVRGLEIPEGLDRPVLVYFHWPHEDGERGRRVQKFCGGPLDDEVFVRLTPLFYCVEVNVRDSEERLVQESGLRGTPSLALCKPDGTILWKTEETGFSGRALSETMRKVLKTRFPAIWEKAEKEAAGQKALLAEARRHLAAGRVDEGMPPLNMIVNSDVRWTDEWALAVKLLREEEKKAEEAAKRK